MNTINLDLINIALERVDGGRFEQFANAIFSSLIGPDFIPMGGNKDGGADALSTVAEGKPHTFYQFSIEEDYRSKIERTVTRLREVGRNVNTLIYGTSRIVPRLDLIEEELGEELQINLRIRDANYMASQVNTSPATLEAYHTFLAPELAFLSDLKTSSLLADDENNQNAAVYVFLRNELDSRQGAGGSSEGLADGLIIWALRETSSEGEFLSSTEIEAQIERDVPGITAVLGELLPSRLKALSRIPQSQTRPIRYHAKIQKYCIAFDLRSRLRDQNLKEETLRRSVFAGYRLRILEHFPKVKEDLISPVLNIAYNTILKCLETEGFEFAAFLSGVLQEHSSIKARIDQCVIDAKLPKNKHTEVCALVEHLLYATFTKPSKEERMLFSRIASAYTLLFCLKTEPKIITYFEKMAKHFELFLGADVLVELLAERFIPPNQMVFSNTLKLIRAAGGKLILTETVLEEVQHHLHAADREFENHYRGGESAITKDTIGMIDRGLIRAYFRGKLSEKNKPRNWPEFINNYCDPRSINSRKGKDQIRKYLLTKLGMDFLDNQEVQYFTSGRPVDLLKARLEPHKKTKALALNDALIIHLIYARRKINKENDLQSGFGLRSWWLTNEYAVTKFTKDIVSDEGSDYLMPPAYLINFLTMLPKKEESKAIFETLFPTLLGVHLAHDRSPDHIKRLHKYLEEIKSVDPARRTVLVAEKADKLKAHLGRASWLG